MTYSTREIIKMVLLMILYAALGSIGLYSGLIIFIMPLLALPMIGYLIKGEFNFHKELIMNATIVIMIFMFTLNPAESLFYIVNVVVPAYLFVYYIRSGKSIPEIILHLTTWVFTALITVIGIMKVMGTDYIREYMTLLQIYEEVQIEIIQRLAEAGTISVEQIGGLKEFVSAQVIVMQVIYPSLFFISILWGVIVLIILVKFIGRIGKWQLPKLNQLFQFRLSKWSTLILAISYLIASTGTSMSSNIVGLNAFFIMNTLYQFVGLIAIIIMVRKGRLPKIIKGLFVLLSIALFFISPVMLIIFGVMDTIFNYRKVEIVV